MRIKIKKKLFISFCFGIVFFLNACSSDQVKSFQAVPTAFGKTNQINVIADKDLWEGAVGDTLRFYFGSPYLLLPQPEPLFDLRHLTPDNLVADPFKRELRTYMILANLNDEDSPTTRLVKADLGSESQRRAAEDPKYNTTLGRDKWAKGQLLVYSFAVSEDALINNIKKNFPTLMKKINEADRPTIESAVYAAGNDFLMMDKVKVQFKADIRIPKDYFIAIQDSTTMWLRYEVKDLSSNILIHKLKYTDQSQLTKKGIKDIRNVLGKQYITTEIEGSYMRANDEDLPIFTTQLELNGNFALESRGIWDIVNDYMGGPYISYLIQKKGTNELLFVDGFVYAPGKEKRDYMQHMELIFSTIKF
jgi:hypothetical protein